MYDFVYILINYKSIFVLYNTLFNLFIFIIILNRQTSNFNQRALNETQALKETLELKETQALKVSVKKN